MRWQVFLFIFSNGGCSGSLIGYHEGVKRSLRSILRSPEENVTTSEILVTNSTISNSTSSNSETAIQDNQTTIAAQNKIDFTTQIAAIFGNSSISKNSSDSMMSVDTVAGPVFAPLTISTNQTDISGDNSIIARELNPEVQYARE